MAVTNQELFNIFLANPNMSDAQIVSLMETRGISPEQVSSTFGIPVSQIVSRMTPILAQDVANNGLYNQTLANNETGQTEISQRTLAGGFNAYQDESGQLSFSRVSPDRPGMIQLYGPNGEYRGEEKITTTTQDLIKNLGPIALAAGGTALLQGLPGFESLFNGVGSTAAATEGLTLSELGLGANNLATATNVADIVAGADAGLLTGTPTGLSLAELSGTAGGAITPAAVSPVATSTGLLSSALPAAGTVGGALTSGALSTLGGAAATGLLGNAITGGLGLAGGVLQSQQSREAAQTAAQNVNTATQAGVEASQFRPVGMTTRFGTSNYTYDPVTGRMTSAGYQLSPEAKAAQDRLVSLAGRGLTQAEQAQSQFAPLQTAAQNLYSLGSKYIAKSPEEAAQDYINKQMQLLQPSRELDLANLQNRLYQQGRTGVSVAQGGSLGATTPELQALYNARAMQDLQLSSQAQQAGQANTLFGSNLYDLGTAKLSNYYGGQTQAYSPYTTALGQVQNLEAQAQQPLTMGANLAQQASLAGARSGQLGLTGAQIQGNLMTSNAVTNNPYAAFLSGLGSPTSTLGQGLANYITGYNPTADQNAVLNPYLFNTGSVWNG
jgi:hypothetical protein